MEAIDECIAEIEQRLAKLKLAVENDDFETVAESAMSIKKQSDFIVKYANEYYEPESRQEREERQSEFRDHPDGCKCSYCRPDLHHQY